MKRLLLILVLTLPSVAQAGVLRAVTQTYADANYLKLTGGTLTGPLTLDHDLITSTGVITSTTAPGTAGFMFDTGTKTASNLYEWYENGGIRMYMSHSGTLSITTLLDARTSLLNQSAGNGCTVSSGALCVPDDFQLDGLFYFKEASACVPIAGYGCLGTKSDDKLYFTTPSGVEEEVVLTGNGAFTAEMFDDLNTDSYVVNAQTDLHAYHSDGLAGGHLSGWAYDGGGVGISHAITAIVDYDGTWIEVTTGDAHGLAPGDIISQTNLADAAYGGIFVVQAVPDTTHYRVIAAFTATGTGTMDQAATLIAGTGAAGEYHMTWVATTTASNNETFDFFVYVQAEMEPGTPVRRKIGTGTDWGALPGTAIITIADGDHVSFILSNTGSAGDVLHRNFTFVLNRL